MSDVHGDHPPLTVEDVVIIRGWAAENHRRLHHAKNASNDQEERDDLTESMRRIEDLTRRLGAYL